MSRLIVTAVGIACLAAGAIGAGWLSTHSEPGSAVRSSPFPEDESRSRIEARVAALERELTIERQARQLLQEEMIVLNDMFESGLEDPGRRDDAGRDESDSDADVESSRDVTRSRPASRQNASDDDTRLARLMENGFTAGEADRILRREAELEMEALEARYEARRNGEPFDFRSSSSTLRDELGDDAYARYLEANGHSTSVTVSRVYEASPALAAGLRPGDQILRYDGQRVFSMNDIADLTMEGQVGQGVAVDILRDGIPMQISLPRGPLGVSGGRRFRR